jgi:hypothetical protein
MANQRNLKAFVRYDGSGRVVAGSLILRKNKPKVGRWQEIPAYECCNYVPTSTTTTTSTTASPTTTTTSTTATPITTTTTTTAVPTTTTTTTAGIVPSRYEVSAEGLNAYIINEATNPTLSLVEGEVYTFIINAPGHPFWIKTVSSTGTANAYNTGVTNNGTDSGTITFIVPAGAPSTLYYNCQYHSLMAGTILITV